MFQKTLSFYSLSFSQLEDLFKKNSLQSNGPRLLFNWHYKKNQRDPCHNGISKTAQDFLKENFNFDLPQIHLVQESSDQTVKFLMKLSDDLKVETVLIPFNKKYTLCLSSQVGCAMNCSFCYTGTQGLKRNLKTEEIIGQLLLAKQWLSANRPKDDRVLNVVFMGQGEPLHNFDAVKTSCEILIDQAGLSLAGSKITVSTAGYLPGLKRWQNEMPKVNIAISFHSPLPEKRNKLIPLNKRFPLEEVVNLAEAIPSGKTRFVTYEYLLIKNFNDSEEDAHVTGRFLAGKNAYISLIPFNPYPGTKYQRPTIEETLKFKELLDQYKIPTLIRKTKGDEILAACGQLNATQTQEHVSLLTLP